MTLVIPLSYIYGEMSGKLEVGGKKATLVVELVLEY